MMNRFSPVLPYLHRRCSRSLELEHLEEQVDHLCSFSLQVELFQVDFADKGVTVGHIGHTHQVILVAINGDLRGATIYIVNVEIFTMELGAIGEYFHDLF